MWPWSVNVNSPGEAGGGSGVLMSCSCGIVRGPRMACSSCVSTWCARTTCHVGTPNLSEALGVPVKTSIPKQRAP